MLTRDEFLTIIKGYNGKVKETDNKVSITAVNRITNYYADGRICKSKDVECRIELENGILRAEEKTCEILGGRGYPKDSATKETLLENLKYFNFSKKEILNEQISLFD